MCATLVAGAFAWSGAASAASRVVVVVPDDGGALAREATTRIRAELAAAGFDAVAIASNEADARAQVEGDASNGTVATLALRPVAGKTSIDVWVHDDVTGKSLVRRIAVPKSDAARVVAIRAIELLRASLLEATTPPPPPPDAAAPAPIAPPPPDVRRWMKTTTGEAPSAPKPTRALVPSFALQAGAAALVGFDGLPVAPMPEVRLAMRLGASTHARLALAGPGFVADVSGAAGTAVVRQELARLELVHAIDAGVSWLAPTVSIGGGVYHAHAHGDAAPTFRSASDDAFAALGSAGGGVALRMSEHAAIVLDASAIVLAPRPVIVLGDVTVASAGRPSLLASLGVLASFE